MGHNICVYTQNLLWEYRFAPSVPSSIALEGKYLIMNRLALYGCEIIGTLTCFKC